MAGKKGKRPRKTSGATKSPTQSQALKKAKLLDLASRESSDCESEYTDAEDTEEIPEKVSTVNMAVNENYASNELEEAVIKVLKNPDVVKTLIAAIRSEIRASFKQELDEKDKEIRDLRTELENKTDDLEMYGRRNGVRIHGIPEAEGENTDEIFHKLVDDIKAMHVSDDSDAPQDDIPRTALGRSHRVGKKGGDNPRAIIVKFVSHNYKVAFLRKKKDLRQLGRGEPVFVNEDLTKTRAGMAKRARDLKRAERLTDTWTRDGVVFVKKTDGTIERFTRVPAFAEMERNLPPAPTPAASGD